MEIARHILEKSGAEIIMASNGEDALKIFENSPHGSIDIILMDIMMPVMDGILCLRKMREAEIKIPVMFLTSRDEEFDKVLGLELGADDYLCKPFSMRELIARIHVLLRRYGNLMQGNKENEKENSCDRKKELLFSCGLELNLLSYTAVADGQKLELTVTEFRLLEAFLKNQNIVFSREQLICVCYPEDTYLNDRAIDCHIKRLRKKLSAYPKLSEKIQTVYGAGYKWE